MHDPRAARGAWARSGSRTRPGAVAHPGGDDHGLDRALAQVDVAEGRADDRAHGWLMRRWSGSRGRRGASEMTERPASERQSAGSSRARPAAIAAAHSEPEEAPAVTATAIPASSSAAATPAWKAARHAQPSKAIPIMPASSWVSAARPRAAPARASATASRARVRPAPAPSPARVHGGRPGEQQLGLGIRTQPVSSSSASGIRSPRALRPPEPCTTRCPIAASG